MNKQNLLIIESFIYLQALMCVNLIINLLTEFRLLS